MHLNTRYPLVCILLLSLVISACKKEVIRTYSLPKQSITVASLKPQQSLSWHIPDTWIKKDNTQFRKASYSIPHHSSTHKDLIADFSISSFPGDAGGLTQNINRWRSQLALTGLSDTDAKNSLSTVEHEHLNIQLVTLDSDKKLLLDSYYKSSYVAIFDFDDQRYFIKLSGEKNHLNRIKADFMNLLSEHLHVD